MLERAPKSRARSVVDFVIGDICDGIRTGRYKPGQRLPQAELVRSLGISRPALREALNRLAAEGVVRLEQNHGASITTVRDHDITEIYLQREVLEGLAARLAAQRIGEGDNACRLEDSVQRLQQAALIGDIAPYSEANSSFHNVILELSGHARLRAMVPRLMLPIFQLVYSRLLGPEQRDRSIAEHEVVADAIRNGEPEWAEAAMRRHIRRSHDALLNTCVSARAD